ncbi:LysR family transcriptional regulator [Actinoplanes sp. NPDC023801]|uniref:LysR family transcriptional regulator n=1 Tax=Actinoplanes sp. NPDC023801 TaxID=3154595 RepID=UPI0033D57D76
MPQADRAEPGQATLNWGDLMAFRLLATELNFTRTAARLNITQPALSVRIRRLEQALGVRLLDRNTRVAHLTASGRLLSDWANQAARSWTEIQQVVADPRRSPPDGRTTHLNPPTYRSRTKDRSSAAMS